ncbi:hypothetical protein [Desulfosporosinus hippei]|uniref:Uncharacterized protein n=1 Tax=Desulfosporosinus hippei DSM 8344 TaxID=1121419 RepID=A0A1G8LNY2_9FIRM|nr:hypothetical protein [Desulfosporosinus hippei]SDI57325.1 hypothetical protein SAMN05443529_1523 [Desulfosporosinus hippei DSM 8344]
MGAHVEFIFPRGFVIDEERLRKIHSIIQDRLDDKFRIKPKYKIYRSDNFVYTTLNIEDILEEDNSEWQKITRLQIEAENSSDIPFIFKLDFDSKTTLTVEGEDRDFVYLFFSDLKTYLTNEVNTKYIFSASVFYSVLRNLPLFTVIIIFYRAMKNIKPISNDELKGIMDNKDVILKLNYLIEKDAVSTLSINTTNFNLIIVLMILSMAIIALNDYFGNYFKNMMYKYLLPFNLFLWGKENTRYKKLIDLRSKIIWGVGVALIISVIASLLVWKITIK